MRRRGRVLSAEEQRLWAEIARRTVPLPGRMVPEAPMSPETSPESGPAPQSTIPKRTKKTSAAVPALPPLAPLESRMRLKLRRGTERPDAVLDLHGMRQAQAHAVLIGFLRRAQIEGRSLVLVVTGKGGASAGEGPFEERGVLRRVVPHWLRLSDLRPLVIGFEEAAPHHGGSGALYVRLRRRNGGSRA
jgi:DNA-nicking Smr family endonuclease